MTADRIQLFLALIFLTLGAWALLFPLAVEAVVLKPDYVNGDLNAALFIGCFGAQAVLCGIIIGLSRFTARTFLYFGLVGSIPFFVFNYYFVYVVPMFTQWMLLDFAGNLGILACGLGGWYLRRRESAQLSGDEVVPGSEVK